MLTETTLYIGFGISLAFTLFCIVSGLFENTIWFMTLGIYNFVLALIRLLAARSIWHQIHSTHSERKPARQSAHISKAVGIALLSVNLAFIGITAETIIRNHALHYHPFILFILVLFSVIRFIDYSVSSIRGRKEGATLNHAIRGINMTVALVSLYTTQTAVLDTYFPDELLRLILNLTASSLIFFGLLRIAVNLILSAQNDLAADTTGTPAK